jgi:hypothetical protein
MSNLVRVSHGLWRPSDHVVDLVGRVSALLAVCADATVVSGMTAARLHGLWLPELPELPDLPETPVEVIVHPDRPRQESRPTSRRGELRARRQMLLPDEVCSVGGLPVTSVARTWLDLSDRLSLPDLIAVGDCALRCGATPDELQLLIARARHRRGVVRARAALPLLNARSRSRPESHLRYAVVAAGLPAPAVNEPIYSALGEWLAEPDLSYDDVRLAIEYNGAFHADVSRMRRDITRALDITHRGGWQTITFGPAEVFRRPDLIGVVIRQLRNERLATTPAQPISPVDWRDPS